MNDVQRTRDAEREWWNKIHSETQMYFIQTDDDVWRGWIEDVMGDRDRVKKVTTEN